MPFGTMPLVGEINKQKKFAYNDEMQQLQSMTK